jgi:hypothetical protein
VLSVYVSWSDVAEEVSKKAEEPRLASIRDIANTTSLLWLGGTIGRFYSGSASRDEMREVAGHTHQGRGFRTSPAANEK